MDISSNTSPNSSIVPSGELKYLTVAELKTSVTNPRQLFDPKPLQELKDSISKHGVLVPITVYKKAGQDIYSILDGERRYRCCKELEEEGVQIKIPANIVMPPDKIAGVLYMFSIHNFREEWELMPTALSLKEVMDDLKENDNKKLASLTGLSPTQVERCKWLLSYPERFQKMSLHKDPTKRIPSNFWIEAYPVLKIYEEKLPLFVQEKGREAIIQCFVDKKNAGKIKSIIHFRKIQDAYSRAKENREDEDKFLDKLKEFVSNKDLEIPEAFDNFLPPRNIKTALKVCNDFTEKMDRLKLEYTTDNREELVEALEKVRAFIENILIDLKSARTENEQDDN